jgi:hypothetical protein
MKMQLTRLRVEHVRQFRQPFELSGLQPGLNIFTGPNEAGKSTLVRAIRAAFFERHRSTAVDDLRPWGDGSAAPLVELDFLIDGALHRLSKSFLSKKRCGLLVTANEGATGAGVSPGQWEGVEAEDHLAQLFGFAFAGKGASKAEHWGIPGLLWVEQGTGQDLKDAAEHARGHLHEALGGLANQLGAGLAASGGDELLVRMQAQRGELLTASTGRPKAAYAEAIELALTLTDQLASLDAQIAQYRQQVDQLAAWRQQHDQDEAERPWDAARLELQAAEIRLQALQASQRQLNEDRQRLAQKAEHHKLILTQVEAFQQQESEVARRTLAADQADSELQTSQAALNQSRLKAEASQARLELARESLRRARQLAQRHELVTRAEQARAQSRRLNEALLQAQSAHQTMLDVRQRTTGQGVSKAEVESLRQLERRLRDASLQREAVATRLQFALEPGKTLSLKGGPAGDLVLQDDGEALLSAPATVLIPGLGTLTITPGGQDLGEVSREYQLAQEALSATLQRLGLADLAEAELKLAAHTERLAELKLAEQALALTAPQGLDALRAQVGQVDARIAQSEAELGRLPTELDASLILPVDEAEALEHEAARADERARQQWGLAQQANAAAQAQVLNSGRELAAAQATLADPERLARQQTAKASLLEHGAERDALQTRIDEASQALRNEHADIVEQDIARLKLSMAQQQRSHQQRREQILVLEASLQQAGAQGLEEQRASVAGDLSRAQRRRDELQRRAAALNLLCEMLTARREATMARLKAPLQRHLDRYVRLLFPQGSLLVDEQLAPGQLSRPDVNGAMESGDFSALSFGAREQLGLISRFAYADLLREAGRPTLLILDDALVHSDTARLGQMKRVIFDAAQRHQVLLFTCHPTLWRDMGCDLRSLR